MGDDSTEKNYKARHKWDTDLDYSAGKQGGVVVKATTQQRSKRIQHVVMYEISNDDGDAISTGNTST